MLSLNVFKMIPNQILSRKNSLLQIVLYFAKCSVRLQHLFSVFDFCRVTSIFNFFLYILHGIFKFANAFSKTFHEFRYFLGSKKNKNK